MYEIHVLRYRNPTLISRKPRKPLAMLNIEIHGTQTKYTAVIGATENAGVEKYDTVKIARVENAGVDNRGGKC